MSPRDDAAAKRDRLSALPDDLLHRILRPLEARQAARHLSLLSRRWRRVWASSPFVTLKDKDSAGSESRGLRVLELALRGANAIGLPDRVFTCATLEEISLSSRARDFIAPKSAVCLPRLKKLHLENVQIDPSAVEKLNSGWPSLEDLNLYQCWLGSFKISSESLKTLSITACVYDEIHVSAPNAGSLKITVSRRVYLSAMPSLVSAWVHCVGAADHLAPCAYDLIAALCNAQRLELFRFDVLLQDIVHKPATEGLSLSNLKSLYVGEWLVTDFYNALAFFIQRVLLIWLLFPWINGR
ncbi:putative F-box/FBD/LRR-repeat protein At5g44950 [Setaria italica]|nr:putative F-box/FBD/LRR-repeat protein At5g44950 [Setaria italica]XP_034585186.1 putative F-box/FBD/LRR-repeat protein At5g44950 [Setaria viridis]